MASSTSPVETRDLLVKLLGMLGSEYDGERASAALKVAGLIRNAGWALGRYPVPARYSPQAPPNRHCRSGANGASGARLEAARGMGPRLHGLAGRSRLLLETSSLVDERRAHIRDRASQACGMRKVLHSL
jgi:hypothetical protein